ncbi:39S ribosomal protein L40, mitochondrial [Tetranychus urticae]|uniref:Large ribosomal subunit protein mL40 n=1 Tax=Tetranychus urticae TaxID=32264 RepID=T1K1U0_TETUR|nr:39S ribosomal protein L40, mitochondrial [Tetranychus urticae]
MSLLQPICGKIWRGIHTTVSLFAEPMKKKRRIDPILLKLRNERKAKRLEKNILKMEKAPKQMKPIVELSLSPHVQKEMDIRVRKNVDPQAEANFRKILAVWQLYRCYQSKSEYKCIRAVIASQEKALNHLKKVSPSLWTQAIAFDEKLIPYNGTDHRLKSSPPNPNYTPPDGHVKETTKEWKL